MEAIYIKAANKALPTIVSILSGASAAEAASGRTSAAVVARTLQVIRNKANKLVGLATWVGHATKRRVLLFWFMLLGICSLVKLYLDSRSFFSFS
jgi:hypothetical protein